MDDRVRDLIARVRQTAENVGDAASTTARYATRCAGNLVDVTKLNLQIFDLNGDANELFQQAGQMVYSAHLGEETDDGVLEAILSELDVKNAQIQELKERVALLKNSRPCPACGTLCGKEDRFCKSCGAQLP